MKKPALGGLLMFSVLSREHDTFAFHEAVRAEQLLRSA